MRGRRLCVHLRPRFKAHRALEGECCVTAATETAADDVGENATMWPLVEQNERDTGKRTPRPRATSSAAPPRTAAKPRRQRI